MSKTSNLESKLNYQFRNSELLVQALSHRSAGHPNNERLEYLGDSILGFHVAEFLYHRFPKLPEGHLTKMRAKLVRRNTLAELARGLKIKDHLIMGAGELKSGGYNRDSVLSNALEAIVGAIFLDGGMAITRSILDEVYRELFENVQSDNLTDNKTKLQELLQQRELTLPEYTVIKQEGEAHNLTFTVLCRLPDLNKEFVATGKSRKFAEQQAALSALTALSNYGK